MAQDVFQQALIDVHGNYRSRRIAHEKPDELISDTVTSRTMRPHLVRSSVFFGFFLLVGLLMLFSFLGYLIVSLGSRRDAQSLLGIFQFLLVMEIGVIMAWVAALLIPVREPIAEYGLLIEGRALAGPSAYWWIKQTILARRSPFAARLATVHGVPVLALQNRRERGLVIVRGAGVDLFVGWTMWRERSTVVLVAHLFRDILQGSDHNSDLRGAASRAMRELIHSVTREGVQAAILSPPVSDDVARSEIEALPNLNAAQMGPMVVGTPQFQPPPTPPPPPAQSAPPPSAQ